MNRNDEILYMAQTGRLPFTDYPSTPSGGWDAFTLLPAQLSRYPLFSQAEASTEAVIGKNALVPLKLSMPIIISHMSCGAVDGELKKSIARAASEAGIANGGGSGGVFREELELSSAYIYEYTPGLYGLSPETLDRCSAVEIKIGQGCGGGTAFTVPEGADPKVYRLRGGEESPFFTSAGRFSELSSVNDLKLMVEGLREGCGYKPVGIKLAAGRIEEDLDIAARAGADFVTIDGGCGGWRGYPGLMGGIPAAQALIRAKKCIDKLGSDMDIIITGGIRTATDAAKALALGAAAAAPASAVLTAACGKLSGKSPLSPEETDRRIDNYLKAMASGLRQICAYTGRRSTAELNSEDIAEVVNFY